MERFAKKASALMRLLKPMLAHIGSKDDLNNKDYVFELKYDGIRALCYVDADLKFISRNQKELTHQFPEFDFRKNISAKTTILDGEIVAYNKKGVPNFSMLQRRALPEGKDTVTATYVVFDILMKNGKSLVHLPLKERQKILAQTVKPKRRILEISPVSHDGPQLWKFVKKHKFEGVMAKQYDGEYYVGKRSYVWLKIKERQTLDCVIVGYTQGRRLISSLVLALYDHGTLRCIGKVGTGFDEAMIKELYKKLSKIKRITVPCTTALKDVQWVRTKYVCEVSYQERTRDGSLRIPVFMRLRTDKKPKECTFEQ